jgi:hypothetical protein
LEFKEATDRLLEEGVTLRDLADEAGVDHDTLRRSRLDPTTRSYRPPPSNWREALAALAERKGGRLQRLAEELKV